MKSFSISLFFLCSVILCSAQNINDAQSIALGQSGIHLQNINSSFNNPGGLAELSGFRVGLNGQSKFLIQGFNAFNAAIAYGLSSGTFGINTSFVGVEGYSRMKLGLAYGRKLAEKLNLGLELNMNTLNIQNYGNAFRPSFKIGAQYNVNSKLLISSLLDNPIAVKWNDETHSRLPSVIYFGMAYIPSEKVTIALEAENDLAYPIIIKGGLAYTLIDALELRIGASSSPTLFTGGFGLNLNAFHIDMAGAYDTHLGWTPSIGIRYE